MVESSLTGIAMKNVSALILGFALLSGEAQSATTNLLQVVRRYADFMIDRGRDTYGPQKSGLFLSALGRTTLGLLTVRPARTIFSHPCRTI